MHNNLHTKFKGYRGEPIRVKSPKTGNIDTVKGTAQLVDILQNLTVRSQH